MYRIIKWRDRYAVQEYLYGEWLPSYMHISDWYATEEQARKVVRYIHSNNIIFFSYPDDYTVENDVVEFED